MKFVLVILCLGLAASTAEAQGHRHNPYASHEAQQIKALSPEQVADLQAGRGMGLALAAEWNGYPGPLHVIEHADGLDLSPEQLTRTRELFDAMKAEAAPLGMRLVHQETELDRAFASRSITPAKLGEMTTAIGVSQATLRATHLRYHLTMMDVLTPEQVKRYAELRGYAGAK